MVYGTAQAGFNGPPNQGLNLASLTPGEPYTMFDGTETPSNGLKSVAFARGPSASFSDQGTTFDCRGIPAGCTIDIQVANDDLDTAYGTVATLSPDANGDAQYTDVGRSAFYRAKLSAYTSGTMPIVKAQR